MDTWVLINEDWYEDNSTSYLLSTMPILTFEEMAGVGKGEVETLKAVMTQHTRVMRQAYEKAGPRTVVTTFAACSNLRVSDVIKDRTGNRRFVEFDTGLVDIVELEGINARKMWQSVNEDLVAPLWRETELKQAVTEVQSEQRALNAVEAWLVECDTIPFGFAHGAGKLMELSFTDWLKVTSKADERSWNLKTFGQELYRLAQSDQFGNMIFVTTPKDANKAKKYRIEQSFLSPQRQKAVEIMRYQTSGEGAVDRAENPPSTTLNHPNPPSTTVTRRGIRVDIHLVEGGFFPNPLSR